MGWMSRNIIEFELLLTTGFSPTQLGVISLSRFTHFTSVGTGAMFVGAQRKLPKKERGRKEKGEDYIISHLIESSH